MPDDPPRRLEELGERLDKLDKQLAKVDRHLGGIDKSAQEAAQAQKEIQRRLEALGQQVKTYIDEDRIARSRQFALTALVDARAEHDRQFGHHQAARRSATGMLRGMTTGTVGPAAVLRAAEQLMVDAAGYWLPPALVALAAWAGDSPESAERAVLEAVRRDPRRSALFFGLALARFGRQDTAASWISAYAKAQDGNALTGEFTAILDAVARGALGGRARECLLDAGRGWRDQIGASGGWEAQVASWTDFIGGQRRPLTDTFGPLAAVSRDWAAKLGRLEAAAAFGHTEQWLKGRLGRMSEDDEVLRDVADHLLHELIAAPDPAEAVLLETAGRWQATIERGGQPPSPAGDGPGPANFLTLCTEIATGRYQGEISAQAARFCLVLSGPSVERAIADLSQQVRNTYPATIDVTIEGWHHAMEPGDDPEALIPRFRGWAYEAMIEDKAQAAHRRLSLARPAARLESIESSWAGRTREGQEQVHLAATQANFFFQQWQHGIEAAGRCVDLLRAQPTGTWSDARESGQVPGPPRPAMKLPDWDPRPPDPG